MPRHFWGLLYWARTGKGSYGYIMNRKDYHHALERYKQQQIIKTEQDELNNKE